MTNDDFSEILSRVRSGDEATIQELLAHFETAVRGEVRRRLTSPAVLRVLDDDDICQSTFTAFFAGVREGRFELRCRAQLRQLLVQIARNKIALAVRRERAKKRGGGQTPMPVLEATDVAGNSPSASRVAEANEMLKQVRTRLSDEEWHGVQLRGHGHNWCEVARILGGTADGRRMWFTRLVSRIRHHCDSSES